MTRLVSCSEFARRRGVTAQRVRQLALAGRIEGAQRVGERWVLPDSATLVRRRPGRPAGSARGRKPNALRERGSDVATTSAIGAVLDRRREDRKRLLERAAARVLARLRACGAACVTFGSLATGNVRPASDLDVLVLRHPGKTWAQLDRIAARVADEFGVEVDLVFAETLGARELARLREGHAD